MPEENTLDNPPTMLTPNKEITIGISSCLLGEKVRYDTGHKYHSYITQTLGQFFNFHSFCPEMAIGLGTPRETIRLVESEDGVRCVGTKTVTLDVTERLIQTANEQSTWHRELCGYILKKDSPSCGMERVKLYKHQMAERTGTGIYARVLMDNFPHLPVEEEGRLGDAVIRENFIKRVFIYKHWKDLQSGDIKYQDLTDFHASYKYILISHDQNRARDLGKYLAENSKSSTETVSKGYFSELMAILKIKATRKNHVNVLQHLQGFLKNDIDKEDKKELTETIEKYRLGQLPLIVPIVLLRHHFRKHPKPFVKNTKYLNPHPAELMLLNSL